MSDERKELIDGLRAFCDFLESNPNAPTPHTVTRADVFLHTKEEFAAAAKAIGGKLEKKEYSEVFSLRKEFGPVQYDINVDRQVICESVVIGKRIIPAVEAQPAREEDEVEWVCGTVLL